MHERSQLPLVTAVMLTCKGRVGFVKKSVQSYCKQDYPARRLLIVGDNGDQEWTALKDYVERLARTDVKLLRVPAGGYTLGKRRNISVEEAEGEYFCQWDDDDLFHPLRLSLQMKGMLAHGGQACYLSEQLQFVEKTKSLYWCDWRRAKGYPNWPEAIPNTLLCSRSAGVKFPERGRMAERGEDRVFLARVRRKVETVVLSNLGFLYAYVTHAGNTFGAEHHLQIATTTALDTDDLLVRRSRIESAVREIGLDPPVSVRNGRHECVFVID